MKKKIIFLLPTLSKAGGERVASELSLNLSNFEITIVLLKSAISFPYKGKLISLNISSYRNIFLKVYCLFLALNRFKKVIKTESPDYVISFSTPANFINVLSSKNPILRVESFMTSACKGFEGKIYKILIKVLYNRAEKIISVSKEISNDLINNFSVKKEKIKLIYNPIDVKQIQNLIKEPLLPEHEKIFKSPVIISAGRLSLEKNYECLIRSFREVKNKVRDANLVILGEGQQEQNLRKLITDLNVCDNVYLLGWQKNPFKFLAKSKIFVLTSLWEGLPNAILEAMACGIPVISVDCKSGPREILAPDTGFKHQTKNAEYAEYGVLTPVCDNAILSNAIVDALNNKELLNNLAIKSLKRAENFDVKNIIKEWDFLIK